MASMLLNQTLRTAISGYFSNRPATHDRPSKSQAGRSIGARLQKPDTKMSPTKCQKPRSVMKKSPKSSTVEYMLMIAMIGTLTYPIFNKYIDLFVVSDSLWIQMLFLSQLYFLGLWAFYLLHFTLGFNSTIDISLDSLLGISKFRKGKRLRKGRRLFARGKSTTKCALPLKIS